VYVAVALLVALAGVVGRAVGIRPEPYSNWLAVPNLWGAIVGPPGWLKSQAVSDGMRPLGRLATRERERAAAARAQNQAREQSLEAALEGTKEAMRQAHKQAALGKGERSDGDRLQEEWAALKQELEELRAEGRERRYWTQDATVEKLGALLEENPRGLLVVRDELSGWLHGLEKQGREGDRQFYLESWNGTGGFTVDRIARGTLHITALTVSVLGGIQPGTLMPYVAGAEAGDERADGLVQRFQLLVWPDTIGAFHKPTRWPDRETCDAVTAIFARLDRMGELLPPDVERDEDSGIPVLRFDEAAQQVFDAWRAELEQRLRGGELREAPAFEAHLSKYRSLMPSLALLFHLVAVAQDACTGSAGAVGADAACLAAAWCAFLELHAVKIYDAELRPGVPAAQALATKIEAGAITDGAAARDIYRHHWSGLSTADQVAAGLAVLEGAHWVRVVEGGVSEQGGRPSDRVRLHPDLRHKAKEAD
jgi:putative DNA primase/helicase